ncbi:M28 family peptidase [Flavobacterium sp. LB2P53]|uniref:M28 family peptidase n=1 Tax=Flavobacterium sp. LB2P53 TaxID=2497481 RepID=UPI000F82D47F|nr:M28 family peptidase [Flavobacterium sp. LB2P53]RTY71174.1 M28 family peptidase [Flavobacterium sp. LB2P53]
MKSKQILLLILFISTSLFAQSTAPQLDKIKQQDLKDDLYELAGDAFRGRRGGELGEMRASVWVAQKAREAGLKPAGEDGTYFQFFNLKRSRVANSSTVSVNGKALDLWKEIWPTNLVDTTLEGSVVWLDKIPDNTVDLKGKIVAMNIMPPTPIIQDWVSLWQYRYTASAMNQQGKELLSRGVTAIIFVADDTVESLISFTGFHYQEGSYGIEGAQSSTAATVPIILASKQLKNMFSKQGAYLKTTLKVENFDYPSINVVAKVDGTDPKLKEEYVLFSGHQDHDGVGPAVNGDPIWNGADDNASVTVAMLAIGNAWSTQPAKRSALFVWHGSEERGLLGSRYFVSHPTVKLPSIVAVLNGDMIGRNASDSAALLGVTEPHLNSSDLVAITLAANKSIANFKVDTSWDAADHPENWYFRSDHLPYAQANVPAIFFTTLLHPDYHTPFDSPDKIDYVKLTKMAKWIYETGWRVAESAKRPALTIEIKK